MPVAISGMHSQYYPLSSLYKPHVGPSMLQQKSFAPFTEAFSHSPAK